MKKHLLATTALAAAGLVGLGSEAALAQSQPLQLGIGGYFQAYYLFADQDLKEGSRPAAGRRVDDLKREGEIHFKGETKLDNGITVGVQVELEATTSSDQIDESYLYFQGGFGKIILGSENSFPYLMSYGAPAVDANFDGADPNYLIINCGGNTVCSTQAYAPLMSGDSEKVSYMTPRFFGFAAGLSFTGDNSEEASAGQINAKGGTFLGLPLQNRTGTITQNLGSASTINTGTAVVKNLVEAAVNYEGAIGPVKLNASVSYGHGDTENKAQGANVSSERQEITTGFEATYAGFTGGFGFRYDDFGTKRHGSVYQYVMGLAYATGPWRVGVNYMRAEREAGTAQSANLGIQQDDAIRRYMIGGSYTYGPGMQLRTSVQYYDNSGPDKSNSNTNDNNDAIAFVFGTVVNF